MKSLQTSLTLAVALCAAAASSKADLITEPTRTFNVNTNIDDPADPPALFTATISDSAIVSLTRVEIGLNLVGTPADNGFASDMFVSLNKDFGATSILLNRVGITTGDDVGFFYDGWDVTFSDGAANGDIHIFTYLAGVLSGVYEPDGRIDPTDTSRPALLSVFNGDSGNGDWRLAVGDLSGGAQMQLVSWSITLTGNTVPEPSTLAMAGLGLLSLVLFRNRVLR